MPAGARIGGSCGGLAHVPPALGARAASGMGLAEDVTHDWPADVPARQVTDVPAGPLEEVAREAAAESLPEAAAAAGGAEAAEQGVWLSGGTPVSAALISALSGQSGWAGSGRSTGTSSSTEDSIGGDGSRRGNRSASAGGIATIGAGRFVADGLGAAEAGFAQGGVLDGLAPSPELAIFLLDAVAADAGGPGRTGADSGADIDTDSGADIDADIGGNADPVAGAGMARLGDGALTGVLRGWRRMGSWAAAMEHAAAAELAGRRIAAAESAGCWASEAGRYATAEIAAALTLTRTAAESLVGQALVLRGLAGTASALAAGRIDMPRALVIITGVAGLADGLAAAVEAEVLGEAPGQTTAELRRAVAAAVMAADPAAADVRRKRAEKLARVERWAEPAGTGALAGRDLPTADVLAADNRINALAAALKADGAADGMDLLRAQVFLGLLLGRPTAAPAAPAEDPAAEPADADAAFPAAERADVGPAAADAAAPADPDAAAVQEAGPGWGSVPDETSNVPERLPGHTARPEPVPPVAGKARESATKPPHSATKPPPGPIPQPRVLPAGLRRIAPGGAGSARPAGWAGITGSVNLTVPLSALTGLTGSPAEVAGFGPVSSATAADLLASAAASPAARWCITVTGEHGQAIAHGCATRDSRSRDGYQTGEPGQDPPAAPDDREQDDREQDDREEDEPWPAGRKRGGPARDADTTAGGWSVTATLHPIAAGTCAHDRETRAYRLTPALRHLIEIRNTTCTFPGCGRPARRCDADHTIPFHRGGKSCECNISPLCRFHHKVKQADGWELIQPAPGVLVWVTPSGWTYTVPPDTYPT
ncbi:MAG TPA: HNH endonuclease signature motif containing protein [Streptosporangiaceae bacterium]|nr:HNH endonuclease signature motif containing protein [Streptosporangiaceae bacterium]